MINNSHKNKLTKTEIAKSLGISRSSLYYQPKHLTIDLAIKRQIQGVLSIHPRYGHKRIAMELKLNRKRILRVMKRFSLKPYRRRIKKPIKPDQISEKQWKQYLKTRIEKWGLLYQSFDKRFKPKIDLLARGKK